MNLLIGLAYYLSKVVLLNSKSAIPMKKAKIALTAIIILGTVGGVLAYKLKRSSSFCTAPTLNGACNLAGGVGVVCQGQVNAAKVTFQGGNLVCTTIKQAGVPCATTNPLHFVSCGVLTRTTVD